MSNEPGQDNAYWRAANYISVGQIYLYDNPLLKEPLQLSHVKPLVVGHWGTTPGQNWPNLHQWGTEEWALILIRMVAFCYVN